MRKPFYWYFLFLLFLFLLVFYKFAEHTTICVSTYREYVLLWGSQLTDVWSDGQMFAESGLSMLCGFFLYVISKLQYVKA